MNYVQTNIIENGERELYKGGTMLKLARRKDQEIEQIKRQDLAEYIARSGIQLKPSGNETWMGLCPFHEDSNPSMHVSKKDDVWLWHCFGCNEGGTIIDYVIKEKGINFKEAIQELTETSPILKIIPRVKPRSSIEETKRKQHLERVAQYYQKTFQETPQAIKYLSETRGIKDPHIYEQFRIGYSNGTIHQMIDKNDCVYQELKEIGVINGSGKEFFEGCIVIPMLSSSGEVVSLYGRSIQYNKHLYLKGSHRGLINAQVLKTKQEVILTESILDAMSVYQMGFKNVVALYGLNGLTPDHIEAFKKNNIQKIILLMDDDEAGRAGALQLKERLSNYQVQIAELPEGEDPNSYSKKHTKTELEKILYPPVQEARLQPEIKNKTEFIENGFKINFNKRQYEIRGIEQNVRNLKANVKAVQNRRFHIDTIDFYNSRSRMHLIKDIAIFYNMDVTVIEQDIETIIIESEDYIKTKATKTTNIKILTDKEKEAALKLAKDPNLLQKIKTDLTDIGIVGEVYNKMLLYLSMSSRKMRDPLSVLILSGSGAGKSTLQNKVLTLCPEEDLIQLTSLTKQALFYKDSMSMAYKVLAIEEEKGAEEAGYAIRNLISAKKIIIESTIRDPYTGKMTTMTNEVMGPTAVQKSTTSPKQDAETKSRFILISLDETSEQTMRIIESQRTSETIEEILKQKQKEQIVDLHQNLQRLYQHVEVMIPKELDIEYQSNSLTARRDHPKYMALIKVIAFIHQFQRPVKEIEIGDEIIKVIEATDQDVKLAQELAKQLLAKNNEELSGPGKHLLKHLKEQQIQKIKEGLSEGRITFTRRQVRETLKWTDYQARTYLKELIDLEYLVAISGKNGTLFRYKLVQDDAQ